MTPMIRTVLQLTSAALVIVGLVALPGCGGSQSPQTNAPTAESGHYEGDGHDHSAGESAHSEGDGHDHDHEEETDQK